jgi:hypothetical protein
MAYNNGFPVNYPQFYPQYQQPYQMPQYQQMPQQQAQASSRMTEVFPAASEKTVLEFPVTAGTTQMFVATDDSFIAIKEASVTGQITTQFYDKRPPAPPEKPVDLTAFVTREELEQRLAALSTPVKKAVKKEEIEA